MTSLEFDHSWLVIPLKIDWRHFRKRIAAIDALVQSVKHISENTNAWVAFLKKFYVPVPMKMIFRYASSFSKGHKLLCCCYYLPTSSSNMVNSISRIFFLLWKQKMDIRTKGIHGRQFVDFFFHLDLQTERFRGRRVDFLM